MTDAIRTPAVDKAVSPVSAVSAVRAALVEQQRRIAAHDDIVMEGRDIGTIFPDAEVRSFSRQVGERARRRALQNASVALAIRTPRSSSPASSHATRPTALCVPLRPLKMADDACELDTTHMSIDEVCDVIVSMANEARA